MRLATSPSPVGYTDELLASISAEFAQWGLKTRHLTKGGLIATLEGSNNAEQRTLSGHVDTQGAI